MVITYYTKRRINRARFLKKNRFYPARGRLNRENESFLSPFAPENLVSRDGVVL